VLVVAGVFDLVAGVTVEKRLDAFVVLPALLVLVPGYFETAGALGGILSSRLSTKFHLGLADPTPLPGRLARGDMAEIFALAVPVFALVATVAHVGGTLTGHASPGLADMVLVAVIGGIIATLFVVAVAYYGTIAAVRLGADPDSLGIPLVTSALDLVGAFTLVMAALLVGVI
jgi:mgtE-like transporter